MLSIDSIDFFWNLIIGAVLLVVMVLILHWAHTHIGLLRSYSEPPATALPDGGWYARDFRAENLEGSERLKASLLSYFYTLLALYAALCVPPLLKVNPVFLWPPSNNIMSVPRTDAGPSDALSSLLEPPGFYFQWQIGLLTVVLHVVLLLPLASYISRKLFVWADKYKEQSYSAWVTMRTWVFVSVALLPLCITSMLVYELPVWILLIPLAIYVVALLGFGYMTKFPRRQRH